MGSLIRSFFQSLMKFFNAIVGMTGIAMVIYSLWMIRVWNKQTGQFPFEDSDYSFPWFIYTFLGLGITFCVITCLGHIAAETLNGCCLYLHNYLLPCRLCRISWIIVCLNMPKYLMLMFILLVLEGVITTDVFLNRNWEQDFPKDATQNLHDLKVFIGENFDFCEWIGLTILAAQVIYHWQLS
ncbi:Tetraspanin-19 [Bienertia sinuspersici]